MHGSHEVIRTNSHPARASTLGRSLAGPWSRQGNSETPASFQAMFAAYSSFEVWHVASASEEFEFQCCAALLTILVVTATWVHSANQHRATPHGHAGLMGESGKPLGRPAPDLMAKAVRIAKEVCPACDGR